MSRMNKPPEIPHSVTGPRLWRALFHSIDGFRVAWREEAAFRLEIVVAVLLSALCLYLPFDPWLKIIILFSHALVLVAELLNTAVEAVVDMITSEFHREAKKAKDAGSAAVLTSLILSAGLWGYALYGLC